MRIIGLKELLKFKWHILGLAWMGLSVAAGFSVGWSGNSNPVRLDRQTIAASETGPLATSDGVTVDTMAAPTGGSMVAPPIRILRIWEAESAVIPALDATAKPLTPEFWRISGVFDVAQRRQIILEFSGHQESKYLTVGDALPNGARIIAVDHQSVTVKTKVANQWKMIILDFDVN